MVGFLAPLAIAVRVMMASARNLVKGLVVRGFMRNRQGTTGINIDLKIKDTKVNRILLNKYSKLEKELKEIENNFNIHDITHLFSPNQIRKELENITRSLKNN